MTKAAKTVFYFGFYLLGLGLILVFIPNVLLKLFLFEPASEVWIRVVGVLVFTIGMYYLQTAPTNNEVFLRATVYNRMRILGWFLLLVIMGWAPPMLIVFGAVDFAAAAWTLYELRKGRTAS